MTRPKRVTPVPAGYDVITDGWGKKLVLPPLPKRPVPLITEVTKEYAKKVLAPPEPPKPVEKIVAPRRKAFKRPVIKIAKCPMCSRRYGYAPKTEAEISASANDRIITRVCEKHGKEVSAKEPKEKTTA